MHRYYTALVALTITIGGVESACARQDKTADEFFRVMTYNIHHGEGMDEVIDLHRIADLINQFDPDLLTVQEVDSVTERTGRIDQAAVLAELTGRYHVFSEFMPYQGGGYGMAVLSKWPIVSSRSIRLPDGEEPRTSLAVTVVEPVRGDTVTIVGIHFYRTEVERLAQARETHNQLLPGPGPVILAGDFNSRPGSPVLTMLSQDWNVIEKEEDRFTFPSYAPDHEIDFVMFRPAGVFTVRNQMLIDEPVISDHRPYIVDFSWTR